MPLKPKKITKRRQHLKMTQRKLADATGMPPSRISQIEHGFRVAGIELQVVERLAKALRCKIQDLIS